MTNRLDGFVSKNFLHSKVVQGGVIALIPAIAEGANYIAGTPGIPEGYAAVIAGFGGLLAIIGRFLARLPVRLI